MIQNNTIPKKNGRQGWSIAMFEYMRPAIVRFVQTMLLLYLNDENCHRILIHAPVKSGKREIVEYIALRDCSNNPVRVHAFISSWHRTADEDQRKELGLHNITVFSITNPQNATKCITWIREQLDKGKRAVLHIDECDFGTGQRQMLGRVYREYKSNDMVVFVLYSATPQEVIFSGEIDKTDEVDYDELMNESVNGILLKYIPPLEYCGPARFLDEGLIHNAEPFFYDDRGTIQLSPQGREIMSALRSSHLHNNKRNIIILRLSSGDGSKKDDKQIYKFLRGIKTCVELNDVNIIADNTDNKIGKIDGVSSQNIKWSDDDYWNNVIESKLVICVIDQTASRSTELVCHNRIFAYHDFRKTIVYTTQSQAQERVNHYESETGRYREFQRIHVYGHPKTFELSAGRIDYGKYMTNPWKKQKIDIRTIEQMNLQGEYYHIKNTSTGSNHPNYPNPLLLADADRILQQLGSFAEVKVSPRVRGREKWISVIGCEFIACTQETFASKLPQITQLISENKPFQNPFIISAKKGKKNDLWQGYLREWNVFKYHTIQSNSGCGFNANILSRLTICYNNNELGIAVRWKTERKTKVNTLATYKSMYHV